MPDMLSVKFKPIFPKHPTAFQWLPPDPDTPEQCKTPSLPYRKYLTYGKASLLSTFHSGKNGLFKAGDAEECR
jgi:hypothetical protein